MSAVSPLGAGISAAPGTVAPAAGPPGAIASIGASIDAAISAGDFEAALADAERAVYGTPAPSGSVAAASQGAAPPGALSGAGGYAAAGGGPQPWQPALVAGALDLTAAGPAGQQAMAGASPTGQQVVADAEQYLGVPYRWGGTNPATGLDCSGLVQRVYGDLGVTLPRTSQQQAQSGAAVQSLAQAQPGDLLFYEPGPGGPGHVGIYIGNGEMIDAPHAGTVVRIQAAGTPAEIRRVLPGSLAAAGVPAAYAPLFESAGARYGVPPALLAAVAKQESGFDPSAVSSAGAEGLMQLMPSTAASVGADPFDPAQAVDGAAQVLSQDLGAFGGSVPLALAAYNAGAAAVQRYGGIPPYPQTEGYVSNVLSYFQAMSAGAQ